MKKASELEREELIQIVEQIQDLLYLSIDTQGDYWDPDKAWDSETIEYVAAILTDAGLAPEEREEALSPQLAVNFDRTGP